jgi:adenylate cyclase
MSFIKELRRRNVLRVAAAYLAGAWLLVQLVNEILPLFGVGDSIGRIVVIVLAIGFIPALVIAWVFEWTPRGIERDPGEEYDSPAARRQTRKFDQLIIVVLALAVTFFAVHSFIIDPMRDAENLQNARLSPFGDRSLAILPCTDLSEKGDQEYFADGIAEELLNVLSRTPELRVPARTSAFSFKGSNATIREIANNLNVAHVLECSVRRAGQQLRITAQLIDAVSETRMWTQSYDRQMGDVFAIQDDIAGQVVQQLKVTLLGEPLHVDQTTPEIFELSTLAEFILDDRMIEQKEERLREIQPRLEQAVIDDPAYFPIHEQLSRVYLQLETALMVKQRTHPDQQAALQAERQAVDTLHKEMLLAIYEKFPNNPEAIALYMAHRVNGSLDEEIFSEIQRAHELDPRNLYVLRVAAWTALVLHRPEQSAEIQEYVLSRDPLCVECRNLLMTAYFFAGENEKARSVYEESTALGLVLGAQGLRYFTQTLTALGEYEAALEACLEHQKIRSLPPFSCAVPIYFMGKDEEYRQIMADTEEVLDDDNPIWVWIYLGTDQLDLAIEKLEAMPAAKVAAPQLLDPSQMRKLEQDPRWPEIAERAGIWPDPRDAITFEIKVPEIGD